MSTNRVRDVHYTTYVQHLKWHGANLCVSVGKHQELPGSSRNPRCSFRRNRSPRCQGRQLESYLGFILRPVKVQTETETTAENREPQVEDTDRHEAIEVMSFDEKLE